MRYPQPFLQDVRARIDASRRELASATTAPGDVAALVPFTGYYSLNTDTTSGAFLSIETLEVYSNNSMSAFITITVSLDGSHVLSSSFNTFPGASFDGKTLNLPNVLTVDLVRQYAAGQLVALSGIVFLPGLPPGPPVNPVPVVGSTCFNPVELPVYAGNYYSTLTKELVLTVASSSLTFDSGSGMQPVTTFAYDPEMYVVIFADPATGDEYALMMGTCGIENNKTGAYGLASYVTNGTDPNNHPPYLAVSVLQS